MWWWALICTGHAVQRGHNSNVPYKQQPTLSCMVQRWRNCNPNYNCGIWQRSNSCCIMQDVALDANGWWVKCVLNGTNIVFHTTFRKYPNLGTLENFQTLENFPKKIFCRNLFFHRILFWQNVFSDNFLSKNILLLSRPLHCIKVICIETAYFT